MEYCECNISYSVRNVNAFRSVATEHREQSWLMDGQRVAVAISAQSRIVHMGIRSLPIFNRRYHNSTIINSVDMREAG